MSRTRDGSIADLLVGATTVAAVIASAALPMSGCANLPPCPGLSTGKK